jgi:hypothetical protein
MLVLSASELCRLYIWDSSSAHLSRIALVTLGLALVPLFTLREWVMTALAGVLTLGLSVQVDGQDAIALALDRAAFFAAFIYLVTLLKEAAQRSRSVLELGVYMTRQPPGRRYFSLAIGGHVMGVLLNFGAISLLTPLIQRGAKAMAADTASEGPSADQLEQQQITALIRGFSWMIMWSPTALTQAVLFTSFPEARADVIIPMGIAASVVMILIGRAMDRFTWRKLPRRRRSEPLEFPLRAFRRFVVICTLLISATFSILIMVDVSAAIALMLVAPLMMVAWITVQNTQAKPGNRNTISSFREIFILSVEAPARSAYILGIAGYIGVTAAKLAPVTEVAIWLSIDGITPWVFLMTLPFLITLGGQIALSPIMVVVFLSAVIRELPQLPADPTLIVFALGAGWALSMTAAPNASATLLISAITRIAPTTLTWRWNGAYAVVCFVVFSLAFYIATT